MGIKMRAVLPKALRADAFLDNMVKQIEVAGRLLERDFDRTVQTWNNKPRFERVITFSEKRVQVHVFARHRGGGKTNELIYYFISEGTQVRYATMTNPFVPKTAPGRLDAEAGTGGLLYVDTGTPRPGIKPRRFDVLVVNNNPPNVLRRLLENAIRDGVKQSGHKYVKP